MLEDFDSTHRVPQLLQQLPAVLAQQQLAAQQQQLWHSQSRQTPQQQQHQQQRRVPVWQPAYMQTAAGYPYPMAMPVMPYPAPGMMVAYDPQQQQQLMAMRRQQMLAHQQAAQQLHNLQQQQQHAQANVRRRNAAPQHHQQHVQNHLPGILAAPRTAPSAFPAGAAVVSAVAHQAISKSAATPVLAQHVSNVAAARQPGSQGAASLEEGEVDIGLSFSSDSSNGDLPDDDSVCSTGGTGSAQWPYSPRSSEAAMASPDREENSCWAFLVEGVLQQVVQYLPNHSTLKAFRATCKNWKRVADDSIEELAPSALMPKDLVIMFPDLQVLELVSCRNVRNRDLYVLAQSPMQLTCLTLGDDTNKPWVTNRGLDSLGRMISLRSLALHDCNSITNKGLSSFTNLTRLDSLSLRGCKKITNSGLEILKNITSITRLNLYGCKRISDKGFEAIKDLPLLRALSLGFTRVKDEGLAHIQAMSGLTELHLVAEDVTEVGLAHLAALTGLVTLALRQILCLTDNSIISLMPKLSQVRDLCLSHNTNLSNKMLKEAGTHMTGLTSLDLRGTSINDFGLDPLAQLPQLSRLSIQPHLMMGPDCLPTTSTLTQLQSLKLCLKGYTQGQMACLEQIKGLRELDLSADFAHYQKSLPDGPEQLSTELLSSLASMTQLTSLDLSRRNASEAQLHNLLKQLPLLCNLILHSVPLPDEQVMRLQRHHPSVNIQKRNGVLETVAELAAMKGTLSVL